MALGQGALKDKKTYVVAGTTIVGAIAAYFTGDATLFQSLIVVGIALAQIFQRAGTAKASAALEEVLPWLEEKK